LRGNQVKIPTNFIDFYSAKIIFTEPLVHEGSFICPTIRQKTFSFILSDGDQIIKIENIFTSKIDVDAESYNYEGCLCENGMTNISQNNFHACIECSQSTLVNYYQANINCTNYLNRNNFFYFPFFFILFHFLFQYFLNRIRCILLKKLLACLCQWKTAGI
jgi:hypothetical protein